MSSYLFSDSAAPVIARDLLPGELPLRAADPTLAATIRGECAELRAAGTFDPDRDGIRASLIRLAAEAATLNKYGPPTERTADRAQHTAEWQTILNYKSDESLIMHAMTNAAAIA